MINSESLKGKLKYIANEKGISSNYLLQSYMLQTYNFVINNYYLFPFH